jgi:hypothetical protein
MFLQSPQVGGGGGVCSLTNGTGRLPVVSLTGVGFALSCRTLRFDGPEGTGLHLQTAEGLLMGGFYASFEVG